MIQATGGFAEDVSDVEVVAGIQELAETEGIFTETAGGVTTAVTAKLIAQGRIGADELTVVCITGNGLKTTDALAGRFHQDRAVKPRLAEFDAYLREVDGSLANVRSAAESTAAEPQEALVLAGGAR
jgi:threonine synthase